MLSGRISLELVSKSARAGLELLAAVSAPSSLALEAAAQWNMTVCGFVRGDRATVYTHERRILMNGAQE
jgi:FdhD protein